MPPKPEEMAKWEAEFNQLMNAQREDGEWDYSSVMQRAWEENVTDFDDSFTHNMKFDHEGLPILEDSYAFGLLSSLLYVPHFCSPSTEQNNKYLDPSSSTQSPLALAKQMLEQNASLSEIALLLEAAIQKGDLGEGGYEAWILLGETRNMDEREEVGMKALTEGVRLAEEAGVAEAGKLVRCLSTPPSESHFAHGGRGNSRYQFHTRTSRWIALLTPCCCAGCAHASQTHRSP